MCRRARGTRLLLSFERKRARVSTQLRGQPPSSVNAGLGRSEWGAGCRGGEPHLTEQERKPRLAQGFGEAQDEQRRPERRRQLRSGRAGPRLTQQRPVGTAQRVQGSFTVVSRGSAGLPARPGGRAGSANQRRGAGGGAAPGERHSGLRRRQSAPQVLLIGATPWAAPAGVRRRCDRSRDGAGAAFRFVGLHVA